jgi:hypothetical protein
MEDARENPNWGTVTEAARHFGLTRQRIHQLIVKGMMGDCRKVPMMGAPSSGEIWLIRKPFRRAA